MGFFYKKYSKICNIVALKFMQNHQKLTNQPIIHNIFLFMIDLYKYSFLFKLIQQIISIFVYQVLSVDKNNFVCKSMTYNTYSIRLIKNNLRFSFLKIV